MSLDPATIGAGIGIAGELFGGGGSTKAAVPNDLRGMRGEQIDLLRYLLGFGGTGQPQTAGGGRGTAPSGAPRRGFAPGGIDDNPLAGGGGIAGSGGGGLPDFSDPTGRLQSFFGGLGVPTSDLQRQASGGISEFLKSNPEQKAYEALNGILGTNPGTSTMNALQPQFERNLSAANSTGPRFGTANAIAKTRAVDDYNLLSSQALMQGVQQQIQASQVLNMLGDSAFQRLTGAYGVGQNEAAQADIATQRRLQILLQLLGTAQSATLGLPIQQTPDFMTRLGNAGMDFSTFWQGRQPVSKPVDDYKGPRVGS